MPEVGPLGYGGNCSMRGRPPDDHPRRCQGTMRNGDRCTQWARKGLNRCNSHGARTAKNMRHANGNTSKFLPMYYRRHLSNSISEAVAEQLELESSDQFSVLTELALMREVCGNYVEMYCLADKLYEAAKLGSEEVQKKALDHRLQAGAMLSEALKDVTDLADKASKIHYTAKNLFTAMDLRMVVSQMTNIMFDVCGTKNQAIAQEFETAMNVRLALPSNDVQGTVLTPDADVIAMDSTIPAGPEEN